MAHRAGYMTSRRRSAQPTRNCSDDRWAGNRPQLGQTHETVAYLARTRESRSARKKALSFEETGVAVNVGGRGLAARPHGELRCRGCGARGQVAALVKWGSANGTYDATP